MNDSSGIDQVELERLVADLIDTCSTMVIATTGSKGPWAAPVYYVWTAGSFWFFSSPESRHISQALDSGQAAASIWKDSDSWRKIQGLQMTGNIRMSGNLKEKTEVSVCYLEKFPKAASILRDKLRPRPSAKTKNRVFLYAFSPQKSVYTNNELGFGFRKTVKIRSTSRKADEQAHKGHLVRVAYQNLQAKPRLGVSACLLGENVRWDGSNKYDWYIREVLGSCFDLIPVCPENECGLGVPREPVRLEGNPENPRLVAKKTRVDFTDRMQRWIDLRLEELGCLGISGFIFKSKSPSCGLQNVKVFQGDDMVNLGRGLFAAALVKRIPRIPVAEENDMSDPGWKANFIELAFNISKYL